MFQPYRLCFWALLCFAQPVLATVFSSSQGIISESQDRVLLEIEIDQIPAASLYESDAELYKHLNIYLEQVDQTKPILRKVQSSEEESVNQSYYWQEVSAATSSDSSLADQYKVTLSIEILETGNIAGAQSIASLAAADASVKGVKYILEFLDKNGEAQLKETSPRLAPLVFGKPTLAPEGLTYKGIHEGVQFSWAGDVKVAYSVASGGQEVSFVPRNVAFFLIDRNSGPLDIEAQIVDLNEGNHQDTACRVEYFGADVGCSLTCADAQEGALVYLKSSQSNSAITTKVISNNSVQPTGKMIGLTPDQEVVVWAQYEGGTQQSACTAISPISTRSLTEENGAEPGKQVDPRCFIATAAWGSTLAPEVNVLRWLRDAVLLRLPGGESLVAWYYAESPVWAAELERQPWIKPYVRAALWPVVVLGWTLRAISPLWSMLAVYVLLCLAFIFVLYRVRKLGQW